MENYYKLLNEIKEYLKERKTKNENTVSIYDLIQIINDEMKKFKTVFNPRFLTLGKYEYFYKSNYDKSSIHIYKIHFQFGDYVRKCTSIYKDKNSKDIYIPDMDESSKRFVKMNYNKILEIFSTLEYYQDILGEIETDRPISYFNVKDNLFNIYLELSGEDLRVDIKLNRNNELYDEYNKIYFVNKPIKQIVAENKEFILRNFYVDLEKLPDPIKNLYYNHLKQNKVNKEKKKI